MVEAGRKKTGVEGFIPGLVFFFQSPQVKVLTVEQLRLVSEQECG